MAEEQQGDNTDTTCKETDGLRKEKIQTCDLETPKEHSLGEKQPNSKGLSATPANRETGNNSEDFGPADETEKKMDLFEKASPSRCEDTAHKEDCGLCLAGDEGHGDCDRESRKVEEPVVTSNAGSRHCTKGQKVPETTLSQVPDDDTCEEVDGPIAPPDEESSAADQTNTEAGENVATFSKEEEKDAQHSTTLPQMPVPQEEESGVKRCDVETTHPTTTNSDEPPCSTGMPGGSGRYLIAVGIVVLVAVLLQCFLQQEPPPQKNDLPQIDIFLEQMEKVQTRFPNQRAELWYRSKVRLRRHLQTIQPTEPVSLILTAGLRAERTLLCLAQSLASAFSSALNASVLHIDGATTASQDSDQVKLDIDSKLQGAFEGDKPVAVIHRFEELPPGSTLIFYRYCDHENAAYKKTFLIFTVLLGDEDEIPEKIHLTAVEEMVHDHLQKKFLSHDYPVSFDRMDLDKYGGLWSRISHLILPVAVEERMEQGGC